MKPNCKKRWTRRVSLEMSYPTGFGWHLIDRRLYSLRVSLTPFIYEMNFCGQESKLPTSTVLRLRTSETGSLLISETTRSK